MPTFHSNNPLKAYQQIGVSDAAYVDPHRLISLLMTGAMDRLARAKGAMQQGNKAEKGELIRNIIMILDGLKSCLNMDADETLSNNLADLYDYMCRRLLLANTSNDVSIVEEVSGLLKEIKYAWEAIPQQVRDDFQRSDLSSVPA